MQFQELLLPPVCKYLHLKRLLVSKKKGFTMLQTVANSNSEKTNIMVVLEFIRGKNYFPDGPWMTAFCASLIAGVFVTMSMAPFDLVATRFYNQGVDANGKGSCYPVHPVVLCL